MAIIQRRQVLAISIEFELFSSRLIIMSFNHVFGILTGDSKVIFLHPLAFTPWPSRGSWTRRQRPPGVGGVSGVKRCLRRLTGQNRDTRSRGSTSRSLQDHGWLRRSGGCLVGGRLTGSPLSFQGRSYVCRGSLIHSIGIRTGVNYYLSIRMRDPLVGLGIKC